MSQHMTPAEYGAALAAEMPALTGQQVDEVARILASAEWTRRNDG